MVGIGSSVLKDNFFNKIASDGLNWRKIEENLGDWFLLCLLSTEDAFNLQT